MLPGLLTWLVKALAVNRAGHPATSPSGQLWMHGFDPRRLKSTLKEVCLRAMCLGLCEIFFNCIKDTLRSL